MSVDNNYTVVTKNFTHAVMPESSIQTITITDPFKKEMHIAKVLSGTGDLEERISTLDTYKDELTKTEGGGKRAQRIAGLLLTAALVAGVIAGAVTGILPLTIASAASLFLLGLIYGAYAKNLFMGFGGAVIPLIGIPWFIYDMLTAESQAKEKVTHKETEINEIVKYVQENKNRIEEWIKEKKSSIIEEMEKEKGSLGPNPENSKVEDLAEKLKLADIQLREAEKLLDALNASERLAKEWNQKTTV